MGCFLVRPWVHLRALTVAKSGERSGGLALHRLRDRLRAGGATTAARHTEPVFNEAVLRELAAAFT